MKRELKFRAYYQKVSDDKFIVEGVYTMADLTDKGILFDQERIKWVEYTGFKDANGYEIYEGDFLMISTGNPYRESTFIGGHVQQDKYGAWVFGSGYVYDFDGDCVNIGSIYTTPELLKNE